MLWCDNYILFQRNISPRPGMFSQHLNVMRSAYVHQYWSYLSPMSQATPNSLMPVNHDDVIKWKHFPHYWPFVRGIHRSPVNSPHKGHWRGALMFSLICTWINHWVNNREADDLRRYRVHHDVIVMCIVYPIKYKHGLVLLCLVVLLLSVVVDLCDTSMG